MDSTEEIKNERIAWREVKKKERFINALRGMRVFSAATRHLKIHLTASAIVVVLGFYLEVSPLEWIVLTFAIGLVLVSEAFNTAIEIDIDLTSPQFHPYARDTKDVAAAAVLLSALVAVIVGLIVFIPRIL